MKPLTPFFRTAARLGAAGLLLGRLAFASAPAHLIDCHQNGDGFNDFTLEVSDLHSAVLTVDVYHTPVGQIIKSLPAGTRLARFTLTASDGIGLSTEDPLLASFIANPTKVEFLDPWGTLLGTANASLIDEVRLNALRGKSLLEGDSTAADTVFYEVEISSKASSTMPFIDVVGRHWMELAIISCKTS